MSDRFSTPDSTWEGFLSLYLHLEVRAVATIWYEMLLLVIALPSLTTEVERQ